MHVFLLCLVNLTTSPELNLSCSTRHGGPSKLPIRRPNSIQLEIISQQHKSNHCLNFINRKESSRTTISPSKHTKTAKNGLYQECFPCPKVRNSVLVFTV